MLVHYRRAMILVALCVLSRVVFGAYDEAFARDTMLPLSAAAYGPNTRGCLAVMQPHVEVASGMLWNARAFQISRFSRKERHEF